jgi:acyl transferase domain-containing protein
MGCRLPGGANSPEQLWDMLAAGRSGWGEVPADRWNWRSFYNPDSSARESLNFKSSYFLPQNIAAFDARFFKIPPREAHGMDPQQRLLLETTFEAIENAGIPLDSLRGSDTSVHVAVFSQDYDRMAYKDLQTLDKMHVTGKGLAILSNRISYLLDLKGPSMTIDTGCVSTQSIPPLLYWADVDCCIVRKFGCNAPSLPEHSEWGEQDGNCWRLSNCPTSRSIHDHESDWVRLRHLLCF